MKLKNLALTSIIMVLIFSLVGCGCVDKEIIERKPNDVIESGDVNKYEYIEVKPLVTMEMEDGRTVKMELYPDIAPETVENFIELINSGFYNGLTFHRTIPYFMVQGGDPLGNGTGGPGYCIRGEFTLNNFENALKHERGVLSMARTMESNDTAGSQFFIMVADSASLNGNYAAFGKVIEGMDIIDEIVSTEVVRRDVDDDVQTDEEYMKQVMECDRPVNPPVIKMMTVETYGVTYDSPNKIVNQ